ncbi:VOC family protein [Sinomicrobium oceani]|uniref:VOC family protein n=1 Tax=Sinomicrobium oceani TaxID=1150368 RepID=UPI00227A4F7D|nr:VOC family protein [Sinomicrobium oceani]
MPPDHYPWSKKYGFVQYLYGVTWQVGLGDLKQSGQKITPCLLFVNQNFGKAESALLHYLDIFPESGIDEIQKYEAGEAAPEGFIKNARFHLSGEKFMIMDGPGEHHFNFDEAISFIVSCRNQKETDYYRAVLSKGGAPESQACGWLRDKYGLSWQVVPEAVYDILSKTEGPKRDAVLRAIVQMKKIDIDKFEDASRSS